MSSDDEPPSEPILEEDSSEGEPISIEVALEQEGGTQEEPPIVEGSWDAEYGPESEVPGSDIPALDSKEGQNGKKPSRRSSARK